MCEKLNFIWKRPDITEYPKVWHTFKARDIDSDNLIEYRIQDLPKSRADEAFKHMWSNYIQDEPIGQALGEFYHILNVSCNELFFFRRRWQ